MKVLKGCVPRNDVWAAGLWLKVFLLLVVLAAGALLYEQHAALAVGVLLVGGCSWVALSPKAEIDVAARKNDNLIDFARQFDVRVVNAWVVRSTYEQLELWLGFPVSPVSPDKNLLSVDSVTMGSVARGASPPRWAARHFPESKPWDPHTPVKVSMTILQSSEVILTRVYCGRSSLSGLVLPALPMLFYYRTRYRTPKLQFMIAWKQ